MSCSVKQSLIHSIKVIIAYLYLEPFASQLPAGYVAEDKVSREVPGASAGVSSQASAKHQEFSSEVKSNLKRKSSDPNPERGIQNTCS